MAAEMRAAFTPGPWRWQATMNGDVRLVTPDRGQLVVMDFVRSGMQGATPRFSDWGMYARGRRGGLMRPFVELLNGDLPVGEVVHPDALLMAYAPDIAAALIICISVLEDVANGKISQAWAAAVAASARKKLNGVVVE